MKKNDVLKILSESDLFKGLEPDDVQALYDHGKIMTYKKEEPIIEIGKINSDIYIVVDGEIEIYLPEQKERFSKVVLKKLVRGKCIGEYSFIDHHKASASASSISTVKLFKMSESDFKKVIDNNSRVVT